MTNRAGIALVLLLVLAGCASPYKDFYSGDTDARRLDGYVTPVGPPKILKTDDAQRTIRALEKKGYVAFGQSSFAGSGGGADDGSLVAMCSTLGAELAVLQTDYKGSRTSSVPLVLPSSNTSYTTSNATAYGPAGSAHAYGNSTTTTYGTSTTYIPMTVHDYSYLAVYMYKRKWRLGLRTKPLDDQTRHTLERNSGLMVDMVIEGSAAYKANILDGDVLFSMQDHKIETTDDFLAALDTTPAGNVTVTVWRNGKTIDIHVDLPPRD